ncbi:MAG: FtsQ-type POTRA domain-containing protein [Chloroflexota bacterium]|nr:FtsQ-type POTRA domain-containing protein [Chloroflexota bacterium]
MTRRAARPIRRSRTTPVSFREDGWRALVNPARIAGFLLMLGSAAAIGWLVTSHQFALAADGVEISGVHYTDIAAVSDALDLPAADAPNVFGLRTDPMRRALLALPAVAAADVHVALPDRLVVAITERTAVVQVAHAGVTYLLDGEGIVLEGRSANAPPITDVPLIDDQRVNLGIPLVVGQQIDPSESAAMLQIGALTPALVGSSTSGLAFSANDADGFVVSAVPDGWRAVFGFYTPTLRPPTEIAQQVQCLRSLLATGEAQIQTIYLAPSDDRCGTYLPRPS